MQPTIRIVRPSSREAADLLAPRLEELRQLGLKVLYQDVPVDPLWAYSAGPPKARAAALQAALVEKNTDLVWAARGGYGASDLLPLLDWKRLEAVGEKILVGFSDVSALHSALYARLGWRGWHAPMPATALWRQQSHADIDQLLEFVGDWVKGSAIAGELRVKAVSPLPTEEITGRLFGGCFSVLTGLIGTAYFPSSLKNHIIFIEDVDESPARLMRVLNQWIQSGALTGVRALVVGYLKDLGQNIPDCASYVLEEIARRVEPLPVFHTPLFGHVSPNFTLPIGAEGCISQGVLTWQLPIKGREKRV